MRPASLEAAFHAGRHRQVIEHGWDGPDASASVEEAPYVTGALALLGRLEEAMAYTQQLLRDAATPGHVAVELRFFAIVGLCHAGRYAEAIKHACMNARARHAPLPRTRFFVHQGLALVHYFGGRIRRASVASRRALSEAVAARFHYGRLLALDLRGHALVQGGEVHAGLRTLGQAASLAQTLGSDGHRTAIECAELAYENRHGLDLGARRGAGPHPDGEELEVALQRVAATGFDNLYALRTAWLELAFRSALVGDTEHAREALERAAAQALPESDHRARARLATTHAFIASLDGTAHAVEEALVDARAALEIADDRSLRVELALWSHVLGAVPSGDVAEARALYRTTGSFAARVLDALRGGAPLSLAERQESPLWSLLASPEPLGRRARAAMQRGWWGLLPLLARLGPGRHVLFVDDALITNDHGAISQVQKLPGHARALLERLREAPRCKEELVRDVWRVGRYAPSLHDPVVHTAIARLRRALGPAGEWVRTTASGYALLDDVVLVELSATHAPTEPDGEAQTREELTQDRIDHDRPAAHGIEHGRPAVGPELPALDEATRRLLAALDGRPRSSTELATSARVSEATMLRRLRGLVAQGLVVREGSGKGTRYARAR